MNPDLPGPGDDLPERAAKVVRATSELVPRVGLVLGSGLGPALGDAFDEEAGFAFTDLPGFPPPGVPGHAGRFALGHLAGVPVASFFGRVHFYEGHGMDVPALLPRLARELGAEIIIVTAAVGGVEPGLAGGTVAVLTDHLNMMGTTPLRGWRYPDGMPAFVPMGHAYDPALARARVGARARARDRRRAGRVRSDVGPAYETPAEIRLIGQAGATVVGMSMVPEVLPARALGMRVSGLAMVTNAFGEPVSHDEVVRVSERRPPRRSGRLLVDLLPRIDEGA